jgi:hypothetical protein
MSGSYRFLNLSSPSWDSLFRSCLSVPRSGTSLSLSRSLFNALIWPVLPVVQYEFLYGIKNFVGSFIPCWIPGLTCWVAEQAADFHSHHPRLFFPWPDCKKARISNAGLEVRPNCLNPLTPNVNYSWRTAPLTSKVAFYIFIQQI